MKVFRFDPETGTRERKEFANWRRASWTDARWNEYPYAKPQGFGSGSEVTVHRNAGIGLGDDERSYRHPTDWICFCLGCWRVGVNDDGSPIEHWEWIVLPPVTEEL